MNKITQWFVWKELERYDKNIIKNEKIFLPTRQQLIGSSMSRSAITFKPTLISHQKFRQFAWCRSNRSEEKSGSILLPWKWGNRQRIHKFSLQGLFSIRHRFIQTSINLRNKSHAFEFHNLLQSWTAPKWNINSETCRSSKCN